MRGPREIGGGIERSSTPGATAARHKPPRRRLRIAALADKLKLLAAATVVIVVVKVYLLDVVVVDGHSMEPALYPGDCLLVEKLTPRLSLVQPGQIVLLAVGSPKTLVVKRVVAAGGQKVEIRLGRVRVDGRPGPADRQAIPGGRRWGPGVVPPGQLFVLGDNRPQSEDSSDFGPVSLRDIRGHVAMRLKRSSSARTNPIRELARLRGSAASRPKQLDPKRSSELLSAILLAMSRARAAYITMGQKHVWILDDHGVREDTSDGFIICSDQGTWEYDRRRNTMLISRGIREVVWSRLMALSRTRWIEGMARRHLPYKCALLQSSADGKTTARIDGSPNSHGGGITFWIDSDSLRVVGVQEWRIRDGRTQPTRPRVRIYYDVPIDPQMFVPSIPHGARVVDRRPAPEEEHPVERAESRASDVDGTT